LTGVDIVSQQLACPHACRRTRRSDRMVAISYANGVEQIEQRRYGLMMALQRNHRGADRDLRQRQKRSTLPNFTTRVLSPAFAT
jgi:hypothetical protein